MADRAKENTNYPKRRNCTKDCGEVNHRMEGKERGACLVCDCKKFKVKRGKN